MKKALLLFLFALPLHAQIPMMTFVRQPVARIEVRATTSRKPPTLFGIALLRSFSGIERYTIATEMTWDEARSCWYANTPGSKPISNRAVYLLIPPKGEHQYAPTVYTANGTPRAASTLELTAIDKGAGLVALDRHEIFIVQVRANAGVWYASAIDGTTDDADGRQDGRAHVSFKNMKHITDDPPRNVTPADTIFLIEPATLEVRTCVVQ